MRGFPELPAPRLTPKTPLLTQVLLENLANEAIDDHSGQTLTRAEPSVGHTTPLSTLQTRVGVTEVLQLECLPLSP